MVFNYEATTRMNLRWYKGGKRDFFHGGGETLKGGIQGGELTACLWCEHPSGEVHIYKICHSCHRMLYIKRIYLCVSEQERNTGNPFIHPTDIFKCLICDTISWERRTKYVPSSLLNS